MTQDANSTQGQNPQAHPCQPSQNPSNPSGGFVKGIAIALVTQNEDPEGLCRVKVRYPWHDKPADSYWARLTMPMAVGERVCTCLPPLGSYSQERLYPADKLIKVPKDLPLDRRSGRSWVSHYHPSRPFTLHVGPKQNRCRSKITVRCCRRGGGSEQRC